MATPPLAERREALTATTLTAEQRTTIAEQLALLLETIFVHRHQKKSLYGVDVTRRLTLLRRQAAEMSDAAFHDEVCGIVNDLRDGHTDYVLPGPRGSHLARLDPYFMVERAWVEDEQRWAWLATNIQLADESATSPLPLGAEITHWNGVPIELAIERNAEREPGSNPAAHRAQGAFSLTSRYLGNSPMPDEDWVEIDFTADGTPGHVRLPWLAVDLRSDPAPSEPSPQEPTDVTTALAVNEHHRRLRAETGRLLARRSRRTRRDADPEVTASPIDTGRDDTAAWTVTTPAGTFGHLRLYSFMPGRPDDPLIGIKIAAMYQDLAGLVTQMPPDGLVFDVRGNPGGAVFVAEMLLQHLTPGRIQPTPFQIAVSEETAAFTGIGPTYAPFQASLVQGLSTGAQYSAALPYMTDEAVNYFGQTYFGPVLLVTDALCFSATDIFAAAFQGNGIGEILGVDDCTGAGGANVHQFSWLVESWPGSPLRPLPPGAEFTVAFGRALRIGAQAGQPLEDLGVTPTATHRITRRDLLEDNRDLRIRAGELLAASDRVRARLDVAPSTVDGRTVLTLTGENVDSADVYVNGRPVGSAVIGAAAATVKLGALDLAKNSVRVEGFTGSTLTAARTLNPPIALA